MSLDDFFKQVTGRVSPALQCFQGWLMRIQGPALAKWGPVLMSGMRCTVPVNGAPCGHPAIGQCAICGSLTCLIEHAMVASNADVVCLKCINEYADIKAGRRVETPRSSSSVGDVGETRAVYLKKLGLKDPATHEEIRAAFKSMAKRYHPDRFPTALKKAAAEKKFVEINAAFQWLDKNKEQRAA